MSGTHDGHGHTAVLNGLAAAFGRKGWNDDALGAYLLALHDLDVDLLRQAATKELRTARFMPTPGELRRAALQLVVGRIPSADEAWGEVQRAIRRHGRYGRPTWRHSLTAQAVADVGGWRRLCDSEDPTGDRIAFRKAYEATHDQAEQDALTAPGLAPQALTAPTTHSLAIDPPRMDLRQLPTGHFVVEDVDL